MCNAPHLSSGQERRTGAVVVILLNRLGRLGAQGGVAIRRLVINHPRRKGPDERQRARPRASPAACRLAGAHAARRGGLALGMVLPGKRRRPLHGATGLPDGARRRLPAMSTQAGQSFALSPWRALALNGHLRRSFSSTSPRARRERPSRRLRPRPWS
jgi:hypothetical protein